jgi:pimeloyl-ACP methyl ester carboxylesterase
MLEAVGGSNHTGSVLPDGVGAQMSLRMNSGLLLPGEAPLQVAGELFFPRVLIEPAVLLICLPGGAMNRRFFDLLPPPGDSGMQDASFSFVRQMTARGFIVATLDHPGVGESSRPQDDFALSGDLLGQAAANVQPILLQHVQAHYGRALPGLQSIGVGHSMGAMITILQQAQHGTHAAVALLGFATRGMPEHVPEVFSRAAADPVQLRQQLPQIARDLLCRQLG